MITKLILPYEIQLKQLILILIKAPYNDNNAKDINSFATLHQIKVLI